MCIMCRVYICAIYLYINIDLSTHLIENLVFLNIDEKFELSTYCLTCASPQLFDSTVQIFDSTIELLHSTI